MTYIIEFYDSYNNYKKHYTLAGTLGDCTKQALKLYKTGFYDEVFKAKVYRLDENENKIYIGRF